MTMGFRILEYDSGLQIGFNTLLFISRAGIDDANLQPARQGASAFRIRHHGQRTDKTTNVQDSIGNSAIMNSVHAVLVELFCCNEILVRQNIVIVISLQGGVGSSLELANNTTRLFKVQRIETRQGCFVLLHDALIVSVLSTKQDTVLMHLHFTTAGEEQETSAVSQGVCKRREEVGLRW